MKNRKWTLFHFSNGDFKGVEQYLNRQAAKGWELEKTGLFLARWGRTERTDLRWCVDLAKPRQEREDREEYLALCADGGWELAVMANNMYLLKSRPGCRPVPVQTDPEIEKSLYKKYYIKEIILSAIIIAAWIAFYVLMFRAGGGNWDSLLRSFRYGWYERWMVAAMLVGLPVFGVCCLWRLVNFLLTVFRNQGGKIKAPSGWIMWTNAATGALMLLVLLALVVGAGLDTVLTGEGNISLLVLLGMYGAYGVYRAFTLERELFPLERRRNLYLGLGCLLALVLLILSMVITPYGSWSTYRDDEEGLTHYGQLESAPVARGEDLGLPLEENDWAKILHTVTPVGQRWQVMNHYFGSGLSMTGCETYRCRFTGQAKGLTRAMLDEVAYWADSNRAQEHSSYDIITAPPGVAMEGTALDWADEAWYGQQEDGMSVLILRLGKQVTRLSSPEPLLTAELLPIIRERLGL